MKSSQTSAQDSTSSAKTCYGWWTQCCKDMSQKLSLPTAIDSVDSPTTSCNGFVTEVKRGSLCSSKTSCPVNRNSPKILWPSSMFSAAGTMECEDTKVQKIRLKPSPPQALILRTWMKSARDTYNLALQLVKQKKAKLNLGIKKLVVTARKEDSKEVQKMKETPADIRAGAVRDLIDTNKTAWAGFKARKQKQATYKNRWKKNKARPSGRRRWKPKLAFDIKFKSRHLTQDSFRFERKSLKVNDKDCYLFSKDKKFHMKAPILMSQPLQHAVSTDCRVSYSFGRWYLLVPFKETRPAANNSADIKVVALDPGVRTFTTYFASDGQMGELGSDMASAAQQLNQKILSIRAQIKQSTGRKRQKLNKAWYRFNARSENLVTNFHWHTIKFLLDEFDVVIAPRLATSYMLSKKSNLSHSCKTTMRFQRHGTFLERLKQKAQHRNKIHLDVEEHGTSMTCSSCGNIKRDLGSSKTYRCSSCGLVGDRDLNAAKNHLIKATAGKTNY
jgi:transposase